MAISYHVKIDMPTFATRMLRASAGFAPAARRGMVAGAARALPVLHAATRNAVPADPGGAGSGGAVDTGAFLRGWKSRATADGAAISNDSPYAGVVEHGRRAGARMPPPDALAAWARRRLGLSPKEARAAAFAIARAIARRGLVGRKILEGSLPQIKAVIEAEVGRELSILLGGP